MNMDLDEIWQEHKRFIVTVVAGMALYFIGGTVLDSVYGADIRDATSAVSRSKRALAQGMYDRADQRDAEEQNAALLERFAALERAVAFAPRDGFTIPTDAPDVAQNTYLSAVERVSADLEDLASRTRAVLPDGLGLDMLETRNVGASGTCASSSTPRSAPGAASAPSSGRRSRWRSRGAPSPSRGGSRGSRPRSRATRRWAACAARRSP